jgi:hypothetical protein
MVRSTPMSVVQHKSAESTGQSVSVTLTSPVTAGNLIIAVIGHNRSNAISGFTHDANPSTSFNPLSSVTGSSDTLEAYVQLALLSESYTLEVDFANNDGSGKHVHLFEVTGYDTFDKQNISAQTTATPTVGLTTNTTAAAEFVFAAFLDQTHVGETFTAGSGYTAGETTGTNTFSMFTEYKEISSVGQPAASLTMSFPASDNFLSLMVTFYSSGNSGGGGGNGGSGGGASTIFLGSVRVVSGPPSGFEGNNPFQGTVKIVDAPPAGFEGNNPYLGSVMVGSAPIGLDAAPNSYLGEVVVVEEVPEGEQDLFYGTVAES